MKIISALISAICIFTLNVPQNIDVQLQYEIINDADEYVEDYVEEYVTCSINAKTVSMGDIVPSEEVLFCGENCAEILLRLLEANGLEAVFYGTTDEDFYLTGIKGLDTTRAQVAEELKLYLSENDIDYEDSVSEDGFLGEFDFTEAAGWMYIVNGEIPDVGMNSYIPKAGNNIEFIFTLYYGEDIYLIN